MNGVILVDKPEGLSSANVDYQIKKHLAKLQNSSLRKSVKVGHAGTLDPFATGHLLIGIGSGTKLLNNFENSDKTYEATMLLGKTTSTDDLTGDVLNQAEVTDQQFENAKAELLKLVGKRKQKPPLVSAKRIDGKRAHQLVRQGDKEKVEKRLGFSEIEVYDVTIQKEQFPQIRFSTHVSKGTFIRSFARDIGEKVGCGAFLKSLRRTNYCGLKLKVHSLPEVLAFKQEDFENALSSFPFGSALTIGRFDGVHLGHQELIKKTKEFADQKGKQSVILLIDDKKSEPLTTVDMRAKKIKALGIDKVEVVNLEDVKSVKYFDFLKELQEKYCVTDFFMTEDMRFGLNREGSFEAVKSYFDDASKRNVDVQPLNAHKINLVEKEDLKSGKISSSEIKELVKNGDISRANRMLGSDYKINGKVVEGFKRGRELGFPTANLQEIHELIPQDGVYFGYMIFKENGKSFHLPSIISVGTNPTFGGKKQTVEVNAINRNDLELYGKNLQVAFRAKMRETQKFSGPHELCQQLAYDTNLAQASDLLFNNKVVLVPTETVYGIASFDEKQLYELKGRDQQKPITLHVSNSNGLKTQIGRNLAAKYWPGALTIVEDKSVGGDNIGRRYPANKLFQDLVKITGPIPVTSANLAGEKTVQSVEAAKKLFGEKISFYFEPDEEFSCTASTVVLIDKTGVHVLRKGTVEISECVL